MDTALSPFDPQVASSKEQWDQQGQAHLAALLASGRRIDFPEPAAPRISIIIVLHNKAHLSLLCLGALTYAIDTPYEVIIVDNASTDATPRLLDRCVHAQIIRNAGNLGFGAACMQGVACARGEILLFLNNDAVLVRGSIETALTHFSDPRVGAVGGKILLADGRLQEAGSIIWSDGSALGYGRGDDASAPQYCFQRPVDYCSGAFLFTPRELFERLGGFDAAYAPAYYEDTDYCMKLWQAGYQVWYEPRAVIHHYESASSGGNDAARPRMAEKQRIFVARWNSVLRNHENRSEASVVRARIARGAPGLRVVYVDDRIPHRSQGSGYPRSNDIVRAIAKAGHLVACVPFSSRFQSAEDEYRDLPRSVEFFDYRRDDNLEDDQHDFFDHRSKRRDTFLHYVEAADLLWVSRPHNLSDFLDQLVERGSTKAKLVFDAEAVFADRERISITLDGRSVTPAILDARRRGEFILAGAADVVTVVSEQDQEKFRAAGLAKVHVLGHCLEAKPTMRAFGERNTFLFIGAVHGAQTPNGDSMRFFCKDIWPQVHRETGAHLMIAGVGTDYYLGDLACESVQVLGGMSDLAPLYDGARAAVIPTRYAAGIPYKAHEAASYGVPMVVSELIGSQLGWQDGTDLLIARDEAEFAAECLRLFRDEELWRALRINALTRILCELSRDAFNGRVARAIQCAVGTAAGLEDHF